MRPHGVLVLGLLAFPLAPGCANGAGPAAQSPATETRAFAMGLGDFPHAFTPTAVEFAIEAIRSDADLIMLHFDDGVPWEAAAAGAPYPAEYQGDLERRARSQPGGHLRYLAITPINFLRDGLAARRGRFGSEALRPPWDTRRFDGWPAESVTSPYPVFIPSSEEEQRVYVEWLLGQAERHQAEFVNWIIPRDYDDFWASHLESAPDAALLRLWKDIGLYRGDGTPRPGDDVWRAWLGRPRR